jgi:hypothetical protein
MILECLKIGYHPAVLIVNACGQLAHDIQESCFDGNIFMNAKVN